MIFLEIQSSFRDGYGFFGRGYEDFGVSHGFFGGGYAVRKESYSVRKDFDSVRKISFLFSKEVYGALNDSSLVDRK